MFPFYTPLKTPENQRFSGVFRGYKMGTSAGNGLIEKMQLIWLMSALFFLFGLVKWCCGENIWSMSLYLLMSPWFFGKLTLKLHFTIRTPFHCLFTLHCWGLFLISPTVLTYLLIWTRLISISVNSISQGS